MSLEARAADALIDALGNAADDAERAALLAAAPEYLRRCVHGRLVFQRSYDEIDRDIEARRRAFAEFTEGLEAAPDDAARLALVRAADPKFLAEWRWRQTATADDWRKRYLQMIGAS